MRVGFLKRTFNIRGNIGWIFLPTGSNGVDIVSSEGSVIADRLKFTVEYSLTPTAPHVNQPPMLDPIGDQSVAERESLSVAVSASDADGDSLTLSAQNLPAFAFFTYHGNDTGILELMPGVGGAGVYPNVSIEADDGLLADSQSFTITVSTSGGPSTPVANNDPRTGKPQRRLGRREGKALG